MSQENVKIVREAFESFLGGDREKTAQLVDPEVEFHDVVVLLHEYRRGKGSGVELETETAVVVTVSGGRVVRIQGYMDRAAALAAVGLSD